MITSAALPAPGTRVSWHDHDGTVDALPGSPNGLGEPRVYVRLDGDPGRVLVSVTSLRRL